MQPQRSKLPRLYFGTESRFFRTAQGTLISPHRGDRYETYVPWLRAFSEVVIVARVHELGSADSGFEVEGPRVRVQPLPVFNGPRGVTTFLLRSASFVATVTPDREAWFGGKLPGTVGTVLLRRAKRLHRPFFANVVGDPHDVLQAGTAGRVGRHLAHAAGALLKHQMRQVDAGVYVSQSALQARYPVRRGVPTLARSNVELPDSAFTRRQDLSLRSPVRLIAIGSHEQRYKGHDLLIRAVHHLRRRGYPAQLHLVGGGRHHQELQDLAAELLPADSVVFHGHLNDVGQVRRIIDSSDIYVHPSRTEGLPRALVEAMARSTPCIGSTAGAIPELLDSSVLFDVDDLPALVALLQSMVESPDLRQRQALQNYERATTIARLSQPGRYGDFLMAVTRQAGR